VAGVRDYEMESDDDDFTNEKRPEDDGFRKAIKYDGVEFRNFFASASYKAMPAGIHLPTQKQRQEKKDGKEELKTSITFSSLINCYAVEMEMNCIDTFNDDTLLVYQLSDWKLSGLKNVTLDSIGELKPTTPGTFTHTISSKTPIHHMELKPPRVGTKEAEASVSIHFLRLLVAA